MPRPDDTGIWPVMVELRACLAEEYAGDLAEIRLLAGEGIPVDGLGGDDCDMAIGYVSLATAFPSSDFPAPDQIGTCQTALAYSLAVGVVRCAAGTLDVEGPTEDEINSFTRTIIADMAAIRRAIQCCLIEKFEDAQHVLLTWTALPIEGGLGGGEWTLTYQP